jgi:hypothetical protein
MKEKVHEHLFLLKNVQGIFIRTAGKDIKADPDL